MEMELPEDQVLVRICELYPPLTETEVDQAWQTSSWHSRSNRFRTVAELTVRAGPISLGKGRTILRARHHEQILCLCPGADTYGLRGVEPGLQRSFIYGCLLRSANLHSKQISAS
jgi:hypothetical protein